MSRARRGPAAEVGSGRRKAIFDPVLCDGAARAAVCMCVRTCVFVTVCVSTINDQSCVKSMGRLALVLL